MLNSMTGYGSGSAESKDLSVSIEIKSVNHRFLDVSVRMPRSFCALKIACVLKYKSESNAARLMCLLLCNSSSQRPQGQIRSSFGEIVFRGRDRIG